MLRKFKSVYLTIEQKTAMLNSTLFWGCSMRLIYSLQTLVLVLAIILPMQADAAAKAGRVTFQSGDTWVLKTGKAIALHQGDSVFPHDVVVTGKRSRIKLRMVDDTVVYVGSKSRIKIKTYQMSGKSLVKGLFDMLWGKARFLVNKLKRRGSSFSVSTKTAVIGVRGTEFSVEVPRPTNLTQVKALQLKPSLILPKKPVTMMLFEGSVLGKNTRGGQRLIKPGILANFTPNGKILTRKIRPKDMKRLGLQRLTRPNIGKQSQTPNIVAPLKVGQSGQGSGLESHKVKGKIERGKNSTLRPTATKREVLSGTKTVAPVGSNAPASTVTKVEQPKGLDIKSPASRAPSLGKLKSPSMAPARTPTISKPQSPSVPASRVPSISKPKSPSMAPVRTPTISKPVIKSPQISKPVSVPKIKAPTVRAPRAAPIIKAPTMSVPKVRSNIRP
jgi:hypothetical protein